MTDSQPDPMLDLAPVQWGVLLPGAARNAGRLAGEFFAEPENVAGLAGAVILPAIVFRHSRAGFLPFLLIGLVGDQAFRIAYRASRDLHDLAAAAARGGG